MVQQAQGQLLIDNFTPQANDRFTNDSSFILNGSDVSGVGRVNSGLGRWATAISRNVVVSAYHARPLDTATIEFHTNNDPNGPTVTRGISSSFRVPQSSSLGNDSDLWVGVLDSNLPSSIASYDLFSTSTPISSTPPDQARFLAPSTRICLTRSTMSLPSFSGNLKMAYSRVKPLAQIESLVSLRTQRLVLVPLLTWKRPISCLPSLIQMELQTIFSMKLLCRLEIQVHRFSCVTTRRADLLCWE